MVATANKAHRPSALKQQNKKHNKIGHKTNRQALATCQGRVSVNMVKKAAKVEVSRKQRRNELAVTRKNKKIAVSDFKRKIGFACTTSSGSTNTVSPPHLVTLLMLCPATNPQKVLKALTGVDSGTVVKHSETGHMHFVCSVTKHRFEFVIPPINDMFAILDTLKVSNSVCLVWPVLHDRYDVTLSDQQRALVSCVKGQGLPTVVHTTMGYRDLPSKKQNELLKNLGSDIGLLFPDKNRLFQLDKPGDPMQCLRGLKEGKARQVFYRDHRPHLLAEQWQEVVAEDGTSSLAVTGFVRGAALSPNCLVYVNVTGAEDSHLQSVTIHGTEPFAVQRKGAVTTAEDFVLLPDAEKQQALWEGREVESSDGEEAEESDDDEFEAPEPQEATDDEACMEDDDDDTGSVVSSVMEDDDKYDEKIDYDVEMDAYDKLRDVESHADFPDEVDTPHDELAKDRFAKFRGLESFKKSPWDLEADLPADYENIFHIPRFDHFRKKVISSQAYCTDEKAQPGQYVTVTIKDFPKHLIEDHRKSGSPLVVFGLLPYEQKMSLINLTLTSRSESHSLPIKSKDKLVFQVGFRRFCNQPIFSEHCLGNKHKMMRYFSPGTTVVASMYAPVFYPPAPVLVFRPRPGTTGDLRLVATGSVYSADPQRCVVKRTVLSGHPFKIHKRTVTVRYMFFNKEDIAYFKCIELTTKYGRRGRIRDSLGTHGHMKCSFDSHLISQDTVLMALYKRVFPKWRYDNSVPRMSVAHGEDSDDECEDSEEEMEQSAAVLMPPPKKMKTSSAPKAVSFAL